ncbi:MAG: phosphoadenosine phosphosulfate reductase family protein [Desulfurococcales archaeon]|nr:phosphoadenosine phosphosulfate reductase family protein [Desulfurococcales archaeon]
MKERRFQGPARIVGWNPRANSPWLGVARGFKLSRDHWLAGREEKRWYMEALEEVLPGSSSILGDRLILFHRAFSPDGGYGVEVFHDALKAGLLAYEGSKWRLYPTGALASLLATMGYPVYRVEARGRLKGKKVRIEGCGDREYIIVESRGYSGVARHLGGDCMYRVKDMAPGGFKPLGKSTIEDAVAVNRAYIERLASEAREFIASEAREGQVYVAVSGGLDSSVALALAVEALGPERITAVYADTGMEFPESRETVEALASRLGIELAVVRAGRDPLELIRERGLMTRDNRWCTRLLKLEPLRRFYKRVGARVVVDGARSLESEGRAKTPRADVNPLIPGVKRLLPIKSWSRLEVQLYAALKRLPVNPLYDTGFQRIGCMVCPAMHLHELKLASKMKPGFYERLYKTLESLGVRGPKETILSGKWRNTPTTQG